MGSSFIREGDTTSLGGRVLACTSTNTVFGKPFALEGDMVSRPKCGGVYRARRADRLQPGPDSGAGRAALGDAVKFDETRKQLGLDDLAAASAMLLGQADVPVPGKFAGATEGTSVASLAARKLFPQTLPFRLPMIMGVGLSGIRISFTHRLGAWVGRTIPIVGEVFLARDAFIIMRNTVTTYNRLVKPEDRVL